ncbi:branched-chain amino acid ABC transporter substrate-binding protein [Halarcobacter bivalviorum]|uniref:Branched chain amino acid ABC transporter substrate-binding protein n=1 Tax=Halarcobacter bivalviorum TaxID=663364 RepID=A0AAX2AB89_9BACT|nr:branched-chain amino acid ABC transporter substrate-binding protein [Halarcobacter bivalviorum]AXH12364.1 high-affinity branched-chain amino acid ABC transporter, periplasmic Leu/Ile/Val-binding protein [Halarcobacter bivalviorum]RXK07825.1 branched chain amino acid ABC transporter substrate-binding protein [Halarcobacter bivalviorum]RXK10705.1 branched chain amino acid ABC transporter substrate-binding protein [Halarcobacter bivalviorum]
MKLTRLASALALSAAVCTSVFAADTVKIGVQAPITGKYANEGQGIDNFVRLIVDEKNKEGGLLGKKIEVVTCDDEAKAQKAAVCAKKLVNEGVFAVIGSYTSGATEAAQTTYYRNKVLQTSDGTSDSLIKRKYWTFFRNSFPNSAQGEFTADYFVNQKKYQRIAILSDYSSYSDGLANSVVDSIEKLGGNIAFRGKIKSGTQNFTAILTKVKALNPDVIYYSGYYTDGGLLRVQQEQLGIKADFVGGDSNDNPDFLKLAGKSAEGVYLVNVPTPDILPYEAAKKYLTAYEERFNMKPPSIWAVVNADGLRAVMEGVEKTKSFDTKKISDYIRNDMKDFPGITGPFNIREDGERVGASLMVYQIQNDGSYKVSFNK